MILVFKIKGGGEKHSGTSTPGIYTWGIASRHIAASFLSAGFVANLRSSGEKPRWQVWVFQSIRYCFVYLDYNLGSNDLGVQIKHTAN